MSHPIELALIQGLETVKIPLKYRQGETISLDSRFDGKWYNFIRIIGSKGSAFLQTEGYIVDWDNCYYISKNQLDGSIQICQESQVVPLYKSQPFSNWQWFTYRITCIYRTRLEVAIPTTLFAFISVIACHYWGVFFLHSVFGDSIQFVLAMCFFSFVLMSIGGLIAGYGSQVILLAGILMILALTFGLLIYVLIYLMGNISFTTKTISQHNLPKNLIYLVIFVVSNIVSIFSNWLNRQVTEDSWGRIILNSFLFSTAITTLIHYCYILTFS